MKKHMSFRARVAVILIVFFAAGFLVPAARTGETSLWILAAVVPGSILILIFLPSRVFFLDRPLISAAVTLCGLGIMAYAEQFPDMAVTQALRCAASLFFLLAGVVLVRSFRPSVPGALLSAFLALTLICFPFLMNGAVSVAEGGTALLLFSVAAFLSLRMYLPALASSLCGLLFLMLQHQISAAAVFCFSFILLFWASSGSGIWSLISLFSAGAMFAGCYGFLIREPENNYASFLSELRVLPLFAPEAPVQSGTEAADSLIRLLGRQYGLLFLFFPLLLIVLMLIRGASLATAARKSFHASLALCAVLLFGLRTLVFLLSSAGFFPFPSGGIPLLTISLPVLCADCFILGILSGVSARNEADLDEDTRLSMLAR